MAAAALVTFLMPTVEAFAVMVSALVTASVMMSTLVPLTVVMAVVVAFGIGIILQRTLCQSLHGCIGRTGNPAVELDSRLGQRILRTHADAAADQCIRLGGFQESGQCAVTTAIGWYDLLGNDLAILHVVELELLGVAEMLEDLSVFVSYCDSHSSCSFLSDTLCSLIIEPIVSAPNQELFSIYQYVSDFSPCTLVDGSYGGAGNAHLLCALLLGQPLPVKQADCLKLVQSHHDWFLV